MAKSIGVVCPIEREPDWWNDRVGYRHDEDDEDDETEDEDEED
jgi:hypothetical protein